MPMAAGFPKRAKRPMEDFYEPSNGTASSSLLAGANFSSMNSNEREKLLQMLEQESTVSFSRRQRKNNEKFPNIFCF